MSEFEIEPTCSATEVVVGGSEHEVVAFEVVSEANIEIENIYTVEAQINQWSLVNDMIYVVNEAGEVPDWLAIAIDEILTDPDGLLIDSLEELKALFDQFEEGYSARLYSVESEVESQNTYVTALISRTDDNAAGIVRIDDTYASKDYAYAVSTEVVGAYLEDGELGGAWFERSVSAIADVAYSAARSASSLNASIQSNASAIGDVWGTVEELQQQVDGLLVTWFVRKDNPGDGSYYDPVGPRLSNGSVNPDSRPYWCWSPGNQCEDDASNSYDDTGTEDTRDLHTGDTYIWYEHDVDGNKMIISTWRFGRDPDSGIYNWFVFTDDLASEAYQAALEAQDTADGKVNTYFQSWAPTWQDAGLATTEEHFKMDGDIWYDSDGEQDGQGNTININLMRRYDGKTGTVWNANNWKEVSDVRINASVKRLDSATVNVNGSAVARSSLKVAATGSSGETAIAGYQASAESDSFGAQSKVRIFGDNFEIANTSESLPVFYVDSALHKVGFRAEVTFEGIPYFENKWAGYTQQFYEHDQDIAAISNAGYITAVDVNPNVTSIDGGVIKTGYVLASRISANELSALSANLGVVNAGVMYNSGANASNYTFMVNLNSGEIHIR